MKKNALEWIVFAISLALVLFVAGFLAYSAIALEDTPPELTVELQEPSAAPGGAGYIVPFTIRNRGSQSAADVRLEVKLLANGEEVETSETTLPLVPYQSERSGTLIFSEDPRAGELVPEIKSFLEP